MARPRAPLSNPLWIEIEAERQKKGYPVEEFCVKTQQHPSTWWRRSKDGLIPFDTLQAICKLLKIKIAVDENGGRVISEV